MGCGKFIAALKSGRGVTKTTRNVNAGDGILIRLHSPRGQKANLDINPDTGAELEQNVKHLRARTSLNRQAERNF